MVFTYTHMYKYFYIFIRIFESNIDPNLFL